MHRYVIDYLHIAAVSPPPPSLPPKRAPRASCMTATKSVGSCEEADVSGWP